MSISILHIAALSRAGVPSPVIEALAYEDVDAALTSVSNDDLHIAYGLPVSTYTASEFSAISDEYADRIQAQIEDFEEMRATGN